MKKNIARGLLYWIALYIFWVMVFQRREFSFSRTVTIEFCYLIFIAGNYYFNISFIVPRFLYRKKYAAFCLLFLTGIIVSSLLRVPLATYLNKHFFMPGKAQPGFDELFLNSFLNIFVWVICLVAGKLIADRFRFQQYIDEMARQKEQAELDFLNAQFNPHFLFNSIHSIYGQIDKQNTTARKMLLSFSDMLRYQLYDCTHGSIDIEKETAYIRNYVALQEARKGNGVEVCLQIEEGLRGFTIAPLIFIAFIENSFKYAGIGEETENKVMISLCRENDFIHFRCFNTKDPETIHSLEHKGIGMANVKRRLALLYPEKHTLVIKNDINSYEVTLDIQIA